MRRTGHFVVVFALVALPARAEPPSAGEQEAPPRYELEHVSPRFLGLEFAASAVFATTFVLAAGAPATECSWCATNAFDEGVRDALRAAHPRTAGALSHAFSTGAAPALALGALVPTAFMWGRPSHALEDVVITLDATIVTFGLTNGTKRLASRARPAVRHGVVADTEYADRPSEWNQSFFSADTSIAFTLVSSATTLSYLRGYRSAPWVLFAGSIIGVSTALLRIAADVHYATDVLTGAAIGTAVGFSMPFFLHGRAAATEPRAFTLVPLVGRREMGVMVEGPL
ncbi:MAG TPA: phosphatase PAP2 family protein [Polyangiaceae bacterium]|nr:phosphatase PAP2 family protein [Polyangiaceae bacterium]